MNKFASSELVLNADGSVYHLQLQPNEIADNIILVGDPGRVQTVANLFSSIEFTREKREFKTITGTYKGKRVTVIATGIGTDNIDIVINELDILANIDTQKRELNEQVKSLNLIRIGTCGLLNENLKVGTPIISNAAIGFDDLLHFYQAEQNKEELELIGHLKTYLQEQNIDLPFYAFQQKGALLPNLQQEIQSGLTATLPGFYAPQGRSLRYQAKYPNLQHVLSNYKGEQQFFNFEMEAAGIYGLSAVFNHNCTTVCLGLANRITGEFIKDYQKPMLQLIERVLDDL